MPLEVNEVGIQVSVKDGSGGDGLEVSSTPVADCNHAEEQAEKERMMEECVRRVLQVLKAQRER
ncbi:hypothetical protein SAMN05443572_102888 [Myxococcus fulvus]|uniref:Uncharacterized protein n=1 Tax=Myxococcus fulvus TaxID=33 RepID=A0A511SVR4_MYXFU|nr:DUF5908 family protein [Myxococcus fulvus]GEN05995.1 hypothetical protein MFU01_10320 [Myxococcus fulvus]SET61356.1 hypothetical protein SAMN05443572_102888 [Myxococcus fulvus]